MRQPRSSRGHVRPKHESFTLPSWFFYGLGVVALVILGLVIRSLLLTDSGEEPTQRIYYNRLWLDRTWTAATLPDSDAFERMVETIEKNRVRRIYVQAGVWREVEGQYVYVAQPGAGQFREEIAAMLPDVEVLVWVWVGPPLQENFPDYNQEAVQQQILNFVAGDMQVLGYQGIHLQAYSVSDDSEGYARLVQELRSVLGDELLLSIAVPPDNQPTDPDVPSSVARRTPGWGPRYKERMAFLVDEMAIMAHASGFSEIKDYEAWMAYQLVDYAEIIANSGFSTDLVAVIPTYPSDENLLHHTKIENVNSAVNATWQAIEIMGNNRRYLAGTGIYQYADTSEADWQLYYDLWVNP